MNFDRRALSPSRIIQCAFAGGQEGRGSAVSPAVMRYSRVPVHIACEIGKRSAPRYLPRALQARLENAFEQDFSRVRVRVGSDAAVLGARAFTMGEDIFIRPDHFDPSTSEGVRTIAHELTHVIQQRQGRVPVPVLPGLCVVEDEGLEEEAQWMAARALGTGFFPPRPGKPLSEGGLALQRAESKKVNAQEQQLRTLFSQRLGDHVVVAGSGKKDADISVNDGKNVWIAEAKGKGNLWTSAANVTKDGNVPGRQLFSKLRGMGRQQLEIYTPKKKVSVEQYIAGSDGSSRGYSALLLGSTGLDVTDALIVAIVRDGKLQGTDDDFYPVTLTRVCRCLDQKFVYQFNSIRDFWRENSEIVMDLEKRLTGAAKLGASYLLDNKVFRIGNSDELRLLPVISVDLFISSPKALYFVEGAEIPENVRTLIASLERDGVCYWAGECYARKALDPADLVDALDLETAYERSLIGEDELEQATHSNWT